MLLDLTGASLSLLSTYFFTQNKHCAWQIGIAAICLNIILYTQKGIYGHIFLEFIYFLVMIWGLLHWKKNPPTIYRMACNTWLWVGGTTLIIFILYAGFLVHYTKSTIPYWDAITTILSLLAQTLMIYRVLMCWVIWFVVDALIAILQWQQQMPFHSLVTFLYLGLAVRGYVYWKDHFHQTTLDIPSNPFGAFKNWMVSSNVNGLANKKP